MIPYGRQCVSEEDIEAVVSVLRSDWLTQGPMVERFERAVADYCGARYAVALSSGTAALHAAMFAADIGAGDEVIVSPLSFVATANCVVYQGGKPLFADVREDSLTIDPIEIAKHISRKTKAIIAVDFAGHPCDLDEIHALAKAHGLLVIEDAAHALGAAYKGRPVGGLSDMTIFSFHPVKHITTGEGGMVLTDDARLQERLQLFRTHGITRDADRFVGANEGPWYYEMQELGYNYRVTDFQCALGLSQLSKLDRFVERRREIASIYTRVFQDLPGIRLPIERPDTRSSYHLYPIQILPAVIGKSRRQVFSELREAGVGVNVHYIPIHLQPYYRRRFGTHVGLCPVAEHYYEQAISLPIYPKMDPHGVAHVIEAVRSVAAAALNPAGA
jgi:UDP-4-amino-4,6-dideoxy-N-acetyl-beta-L-altrosamine transaminase